MKATERVRRDFRYTNEDGDEGFVEVSFGPWGEPGSIMGNSDAPIMVDFQDAVWMGVETTDEFVRWFRIAMAEAKRRHQSRHPTGRSEDAATDSGTVA